MTSDGEALAGVRAATGGGEDARVARVYAFLAAALAGDRRPDADALAAELARILEVQALAVLHRDADRLVPVMAFGFDGDVVGALGSDLVARALDDRMPALADGAAPHRSRLVVPASFGGQPWGVVAVASGVADAIGSEVVARVADLAQGIAVVVGPLVPDGSPRASRERRVRRGIEALAALLGTFAGRGDVASGAQALVEALEEEFGWERVLLVVERPGLGVLPLSVAGDVKPSAIAWPRRLGLADAPLVEDSRSHRRVLLPGLPLPTALAIESTSPTAFDDLDDHVLRTLAPVMGAALDGLSGVLARRANAHEEDRANVRQRRRFTSLAHELRTPVTVMLGYADLLATPGPDSEQRQAYASTLSRHARALGRMVDNALVAWQLDDDSLEISTGPVDLRECAGIAMGELGAMDIPLDGVEPILALADPFWLPRVLQALVENARRFVPDAQVQLTTRVVDDRVLLAVHDDGPGIASDELVHIFEAFHRGRDLATTPHRGVGLGLTVARALVREMGGDLDAASAAGYGTTFTITLPRA